MKKLSHLVGVLFVMVALIACEDKTAVNPQAVIAGEVGDMNPALSDNQLRLWVNSCALCHVTGVGGAPRVGSIDEWQPRLDQGKGELLRHTLEGFNNMPPLGYCMACEEEDFSKLINFMSAGSP